MRFSTKALLLFVFLSAYSFAAGACIGSTANFTCGDTVTESCTLNDSIFTSNTCFMIGANNVEIKCDGKILYGNNVTNKFGIYSTYDGTIVKDCDIREFHYGVYLISSVNSRIENSNISSTHATGYPVYIYNGCYYNNVTDTKISSSYIGALIGLISYQNRFTNVNITSAGTGLKIDNSGSNTITNSRINGTATGTYIYNSQTTGNTVKDTQIYSSGGIGLYIYYSSSNIINNVTAASASSSGSQIIVGSNNNAVSNSNFTSGSNYGLYHATSSGNSFTNVSATSASNIGAYALTCSDTTFTNLTALASTSIALYISASNNTLVTESALHGKQASYGALLIYSGSLDTTIRNTTINGSGGTYAATMQSTASNRTRMLNNTILNASTGIYDVASNDLLIDCMWNPMTGINVTGYGIRIRGFNATVQNCNVSNYGSGIYLDAATNGTIRNSIIESTATSGVPVSLGSSANNNRIYNITASTPKYIALYFTSSSFNSLYNCSLSGKENTYGALALINSAQNNTVENCTVNGNAGSVGATVRNGDNSNNSLTNVSVYNAANLIGATTAATGLYIDCKGTTLSGNGAGYAISSIIDNTTITNCRTENTQAGIYLTGTKGNLIANSTITSAHASGVGIGLNDIHNSRVENTTINVSTGYSYFTLGASNNTINNSVIIGKQNSYGAWLFWAGTFNNTIENTVIDGQWGTYAVVMGNGDNYNNKLINVTFQNGSNAIRNTGGSNLYIDCKGTTMYGINASGTYGFYTTEANNTIRNCNIDNFYIGAYILNTRNATIDNVTLKATKAVYSAVLYNSNESTIKDSRILSKDNTWGALLLYGGATNNLITGNTIDGMGGTRAMSIQIGYDFNNTVSNNTFMNATSLLYMTASANWTKIFGNNFSNTGMTPTWYIQDTAGQNFYNDSTEGNLWGDINNNASTQANGTVFSTYFPTHYIGTNGSGVPYNISKSLKFSCNFAGCQDNFPITAIFGGAAPSSNVTAGLFIFNPICKSWEACFGTVQIPKMEIRPYRVRRW